MSYFRVSELIEVSKFPANSARCRTLISCYNRSAGGSGAFSVSLYSPTFLSAFSSLFNASPTSVHVLLTTRRLSTLSFASLSVYYISGTTRDPCVDRARITRFSIVTISAALPPCFTGDVQREIPRDSIKWNGYFTLCRDVLWILRLWVLASRKEMKYYCRR